MQDNELLEETSQWVGNLDAVFTSTLSTGESNALIREVFSTFLLLRWADMQDSEQEAMAIFEDRSYQPLLPEQLQWRHWVSLDHPTSIAKQLHELAGYIEGLRGNSSHPLVAYLHPLVAPLRHVLEVNFAYLIDLVRWLDKLPFDTSSARYALLNVYDKMLAETSDVRGGQFSTPVNIARLVVALADPKPGERVYDPCFGLGNFLVVAWQHAERSRIKQHRSGALLEASGIEISANTFLIGLTRMLLAGIDNPRLALGNSLERESLSSPSQQGFDVVLADPPFGVKAKRDPYCISHFPVLTSDSTGLFVQHALSQLKPHGRAVLAVPEGFLYRGGAERELRRCLLEKGQVEAIVGLPAGVFAPYTNVKSCLLVLNKQGGASRVRMVDASSHFDQRSGRKPPVISEELADQLANDIRSAELRKRREPRPGTPEGTPGSGVLSRSIWEVSVDELASIDWDLSPRLREKGGLDEFLASLKEAPGETVSVATLSDVAEVIGGRSIKSADLLDAPPLERATGYVRIRDLSKGSVGRVSSWLRPEVASVERRWALLSGDVLVSKSGTIGKAAMVRDSAVGSVAAGGLYVLRAHPERLDAGFLQAYLASPACQNWLAAQSRGAVIQHLNRVVLDQLPLPLPPLHLQAQAAAQYREFGTDALAFLSQIMGNSEPDRLSIWLAELDAKVPRFVRGLDDTPALSHFEPIVALARPVRRWLDQEQVSSQAARWLAPLTSTLLPLAGVAQVPEGAGLLSVLQEAERGVAVVLERATGHRPTTSQARAISERLRDWLRAATTDLINAVGLKLSTSPELLTAGSFAEFSVGLENLGALPLRNVRVETQPHWGVTELPYLAERASFAIHLQGDVPKQGRDLPLRLLWKARSLSGEEVNGQIELIIRVANIEHEARTKVPDLGGSPYVTGSPLKPQHGHDVFYGREGLMGKISRQIATHGNVVLLEGNRRAGKTSILRHLEGRTAIPGWLAVYSSLQGAEGSSQAVGVPTAEVFREIARSIATALTKLGIEVTLPNGQIINAGKPALGIARACREGISVESPFSDFRDYLELVLAILEPLALGLVLMLDEFDKLQEGIDNGVTSPQVPENIRFLIQSYPKFSAILTGSRRLKRLREEYWSALYGLGTSIPVTALDEQSARKVVTEPVRDQLIYSEEAIDRVIKVTARHPYLMQCLCNRIFDYAVQTKSHSITVSVINDAARGLVRDNEHFASLWDYAGWGPETGRQRRQLILLQCADSLKQGTHIDFGTLHELLVQEGVNVDDAALDVDLTYLRELELIEFCGEIGDTEYRLAIPLMADWIEQQKDGEVVASHARTEAEEENV
ncbi:type I restriction-modification system methyltransferase subunit [Marinobacterium nitratireducens]|uniref:site-specific DNA-methyltransferase (adenine-specific) n=1 Tax=Marinobacterium nitratireducens TaxID=518897 RepID=A0A917ZAQ9_9GAMM|nr:N-6 DNA methylase [Marinobacterium nitratireducens]GGO77635.1 type I restriction-modification system methyltransferase subunit [Marinobacterium nitratireducens]